MQITKLVVETLQRPSTASNGSSLAKELWERIDAFMNDAARKNLKVEIEVAKMPRLDHVPLHLLCKSHTSEKIDLTNIQTVAKVEVKIGLWEKIVKREPQVIFTTKCVVTVVVIPVLLKLVSRDADGKSSSFSEKFDLLLEEDEIRLTAYTRNGDLQS